VTRPWKFLEAALVTAIAVAALVGCERRPTPDEPAANANRPSAPDTPVATSGRKVWIIGWDGMSPNVLQPLLQEGKLPNLERLMSRGAYGRLTTIKPTHSPIIWTSIATGKEPAKHGITGFWHEVPADRAYLTAEEQAQIQRLQALGYIGGQTDGETVNVLYDSRSRRARTLWDIASEKGLTCTVIGWWVSWPAERVNGVLVSDRFTFNRFALVSARLGARDDRSSQLVYPPALEAELAKLITDPKTVSAETIGQFVDGGVTLNPDLEPHDPLDELRIVYAQDESHVEMAKRLLSRRNPDLFALYIQGTDIVCHYFLKYRFPQEWESRYDPVPVDDIRRYGRVIDRYFQLQDRRLGELLQLADRNTTVLVLSDHGFLLGKRIREGVEYPTISGVHGPNLAPDGVIVLYGAGVREGVKLHEAHVYDVAPTVLTLLGLPVARDMDGKVLTEVLADFAPGKDAAIKYVDSYETPGVAAR
jgi:predicted AlkP superfamily phosphohydrolase/phosphomutase